MSFSSSFATGYQVGSDIAAKRLIKKEKERAKKLVEDLQSKIEEYQLSGDEMTYGEKLQLGVMVSQLGDTYADTFNSINTAQSSYDKEKMVQEAQNLRSKNDNLTSLIKEMDDNPYLAAADMSALDRITGMNLSQIFDKDTIDQIKNKETRQTKLNEILDITGKLPEEYRKSHLEQQGVIEPGLESTQLPQADYTGAVNYLSKFKNANAFESQKPIAEKHFGVDLSGVTFNSLQEQKDAIQKSANTYFSSPQEAINNSPDLPGMTKKPVQLKEGWKVQYDKAGSSGGTQDLNDVLFGANGIMSDYVNTGQELGEQQKAEIRNNYLILKPSMSPEMRQQVEQYLQGIGVPLTAPQPQPTQPEPTAQQPGLFQQGINAVKGFFGGGQAPAGQMGSPAQAAQQAQQKNYQTMTEEELYNLAEQGDEKAYEEAKRRGII